MPRTFAQWQSSTARTKSQESAYETEAISQSMVTRSGIREWKRYETGSWILLQLEVRTPFRFRELTGSMRKTNRGRISIHLTHNGRREDKVANNERLHSQARDVPRQPLELCSEKTTQFPLAD